MFPLYATSKNSFEASRKALAFIPMECRRVQDASWTAELTGGRGGAGQGTGGDEFKEWGKTSGEVFQLLLLHIVVLQAVSAGGVGKHLGGRERDGAGSERDLRGTFSRWTVMGM